MIIPQFISYLKKGVNKWITTCLFVIIYSMNRAWTTFQISCFTKIYYLPISYDMKHTGFDSSL